jgi:hypothetical protein
MNSVLFSGIRRIFNEAMWLEQSRQNIVHLESGDDWPNKKDLTGFAQAPIRSVIYFSAINALSKPFPLYLPRKL